MLARILVNPERCGFARFSYLKPFRLTFSKSLASSSSSSYLNRQQPLIGSVLRTSQGCCFQRTKMMIMMLPRRSLILGSHVKEALANGVPVVALESTLITHGLPEPENLRLALQLEQLVECSWPAGKQVIAATIGIVKGQLIVGLSKDELAYLANKDQSKPLKVSARDIAIARARKASAGTTVAASLAAAYATHFLPIPRASGSSNIRVFCTGGSGGVHVGAPESMDISADLPELARTPICCVSSGFKSFLDARKSLEYLETLGCLVMSVFEKEQSTVAGAAKETTQLLCDQANDGFPAFFRRSEGIPSPCQVETLHEAALILHYNFEPEAAEAAAQQDSELVTSTPYSLRPLQRGALLGVPIPAEFALNHDQQVDLVKQVALQVDSRKDLQGREKTPIILEQLRVASGGRTLRANLELLKNNARIAGRLALEYAQLTSRSGCHLRQLASSPGQEDPHSPGMSS